MTVLYCDFAWNKPDPTAVHAAGYVGVIGYLSPDTTGKNLAPTDATAYRAAGLDVLLVWETTANRALDGSNAGALDAQAALAQARAIGYPTDHPLFANVGDFVAMMSDIPVIAAYYTAFASTCAASGQKAGGYGTGFIIDQLAQRGALGVWWQNAIDDAGFPGSDVSPAANIYQRVTPTLSIPGADYDEDVVVKPWADPAPTEQPVLYPGDTMKSTPVRVSISGGHGWFPSPVPAGNVVNVVVQDENPDVVGRYDVVPTSWACAAQPGSHSPNGSIVVSSPVDGTFGVVVWSVTG